MENSFIAQKKERLDKFLTAKFPSFSRAYLKGQVKLGNFLVNGKKNKPSFLLSEDDQVKLAPRFTLPDTTKLIPNPAIKLNIIYEDNDVLVINKPAGLAVHPRQSKGGAPLTEETDNTLVSGLLNYYPLLAKVGDPSTISGQVNIRPGIVHRLDKDTSGVLIIAKNQPSFDWLKKQFKERKVQKKYLALVQGSPKNIEGEISQSLARSPKNPAKQKISQGGREAITQYKVLKQFKKFSLLEVWPKTGRLHQIRVHLAWLGNPIVGDKKYSFKNQLLPKGLNRQFLHAAELQIILPNGQKKQFYSPLPTELTKIITQLEKNSN